MQRTRRVLGWGCAVAAAMGATHAHAAQPPLAETIRAGVPAAAIGLAIESHRFAPDEANDEQDLRGLFSRQAQAPVVASRDDVDDYRRTLLQARGEAGEDRPVTPSTVRLAEEYRKRARGETDYDVKGPLLDANDAYARLGIVRAAIGGETVRINPGDPRVGGEAVTPALVRAMGGRYASARRGPSSQSYFITGANYAYGSPPIAGGTSGIVRGEVPLDTIRMTAAQREQFARTRDTSILDQAAQELIHQRHAHEDVLRELNARRAEGEHVAFGQVVAERRERARELELALAQRQAAAPQVAAAPQAPAAGPGQAPGAHDPLAAELAQQVALLERTEQRIEQISLELNELRQIRDRIAQNVRGLAQRHEAQRNPPAPGNAPLTRDELVRITQDVMIANADLAIRAMAGDEAARRDLWAIVQKRAGEAIGR